MPCSLDCRVAWPSVKMQGVIAWPSDALLIRRLKWVAAAVGRDAASASSGLDPDVSKAGFHGRGDHRLANINPRLAKVILNHLTPAIRRPLADERCRGAKPGEQRKGGRNRAADLKSVREDFRLGIRFRQFTNHHLMIHHHRPHPQNGKGFLQFILNHAQALSPSLEKESSRLAWPSGGDHGIHRKHGRAG